MAQRRKYFDAGVYMVKSRKNGAAYIGASCFVQYRLECHVASILNGRHSNKYLRDGFRDHTEDDLELHILERCKVYPDPTWEYNSPTPTYRWIGRRDLLERERHWIRTLNPSLNRNKRAPRVGVHIPIHEPEPNAAVSAA